MNGIDVTVLIVYLTAVVAFGTWVGRGARNLAEYAVGGRNLPWWLIFASIVATETSTVTFLSIPGFAFTRDLTWLQIALGFLIGRIVVAYLLLPRYFDGSLLTAYEVLDRRFGGATKKVASAMFVVTRSLADGLRLFLTAIVLREMTGLAMHTSVVLIGVATIVYTVVGGMRAVLWTDLVQLAVYLSGAVIALGVLIARVPGGFETIVATGAEAGKWRIVDPTFDLSEPYALAAGLVGGAFVTLGSHGVDQLMVQRFLSSRGLRDARRALILSGFAAVAQFALFLTIGVGLFAFYQSFPPATAFERGDQVFARFILDAMPVGLLGILLGAVFAAAMSTLSSSLNACATAIANDFSTRADDRQPLRRIRLLTVAFGLVQIAVGIGGQWLESSVVSSVLGIAAFTTGIVLGVFFLGIFTRVDQRAALVGLGLGLVTMTAIFFATPLAWPWFALVGSMLTFGFGVLTSALGGGFRRHR